MTSVSYRFENFSAHWDGHFASSPADGSNAGDRGPSKGSLAESFEHAHRASVGAFSVWESNEQQPHHNTLWRPGPGALKTIWQIPRNIQK